MAIKIGVVCEGSHDFNVLSVFLNKMLGDLSIELSELSCLQPEVAATFQTTGGGWTQVKAWCEEGGGEGYRRYIDRPIFAASTLYDIIIVHLDGDVVDHCHAPPLTNLSLTSMSVSAAISSLKSAILQQWLTVHPTHSHRIVACIPMQHLEAWLTAGIDEGAENVEDRSLKDEFRRGPSGRGRASWRVKYIKAAKAAVDRVERISSVCHSFREFDADLTQSVQMI